LTAKVMVRHERQSSKEKSARKCDTGRQSRNVFGRLLERWKEEYAPKQPEDDWHPLFVEALHRQPYIEYLLDILLSDSIEERASVVAEYGKEVKKIEQRISEFTASHPAGCDERSRGHSAGTERPRCDTIGAVL
jgi:mRNA deadenylase 3'-5' endonuclease subunit Ccr4